MKSVFFWCLSAITREIFIPQYPSKDFAARSCQYGHFKPMADSVRLLELKLEIKNRFSKMTYLKKQSHTSPLQGGL